MFNIILRNNYNIIDDMTMTNWTLKSSFLLAICYPACIMTVDTAITRYFPIGSEIKQLDWDVLSAFTQTHEA